MLEYNTDDMRHLSFLINFWFSALSISVLSKMISTSHFHQYHVSFIYYEKKLYLLRFNKEPELESETALLLRAVF